MIVGIVLGADTVSTDDGVQEIVEHYSDNKDKLQIGAFLTVPAAALLVFFGGYLRKVLSAAEGSGGILSMVSFIGLVIVAVAASIDQTIILAMTETVDDISPESIQTLHALFENDFLPFALGVQVFLFATGISIVRHGAFPAWMGWVLIVGGIATVSPLFPIGLLAAALFVLVSSVMLTMRARAA